jgi:hypothetical protein
MRKIVLLCALLVCLANARPAEAFFEDLCLPRPGSGGTLTWCLTPNCPPNTPPNQACPQQTIDFGTVKPGRSMIHMDSTYFIAQALGYRADVAYWIAAYNEVTDYNQYVPIDQCGIQAANQYTITNGTTLQTVVNSGRDYISAQFNGFQRTNTATDGPLDHYIVNYSPNGQGTDVHGAGGVSALYPFHYPKPGYPLQIDDEYQKTLANLRQWGMLKSSDPGLLCTVGLLDPTGTRCLTGATISGKVPFFFVGPNSDVLGVPISVPTGRKVLNSPATTGGRTVYYEELGAFLKDPQKTTGKLWMSPTPTPVPVQLARIGIYLHTLQDSSSHATFCGDDAPSPPGGADPGTYMSLIEDKTTVQLSFGNSCSNSPHLAGHVQETGTGDAPLPLRVYVALNNTVDELIVFGNEVARQNGWLANPELLPPDVTGGKNAQGANADELKRILVGKIVQGQAYSNAEVYQSGVVTQPLQQTNSLDRLHAMNAALAAYSDTVRARSDHPAQFTRFAHMPGNSANPDDTSVCWKTVGNTTAAATGAP